MLIAALFLAAHATSTHWTLTLEFGPKPKFAEMSDAEASDGLAEAIRDKFTLELGKLDHEVELLDAKPIRGHEDDQLAWQKFAGGGNVERCYLLRIDKWKQRNFSQEEIVNNPNRPASETTVELKMWRFDPPFGTLFPPGKKDLVGIAGAKYFGTTDRADMMGSPDAKALEIGNIDKKRMQAIASATWDAVQAQLGAR